MGRMINDQLAEEIQLSRPAATVAEWVFRVCLGLLVVLGLLGSVLRLMFSEERVEEYSGIVGVVAGIIFIGCFLYVINYMTWRFCPTRWIRWSWFAIEGIVAFAIIMATLNG